MSSSASDPGTGIPPSLAGRIEALERETAALTAALAHAQQVRLWITLALVAFIGLTITVFYRQGKLLTEEKNLEQLRELAEKSLNAHQDQFLAEAQKLFNRTHPKVTEAFYAQAKKDSPKYLQGIELQRDKFVANLQEHLTTKLANRFQKSLDQHEALLKQEFPVADNPQLHDRMLENVELALRKLSKKYYGDQLEKQMLELYGNWDLFPPADPPSSGQASLEDQLIGTLLEVLTVRLKRTETVAME
jgi:hypothetical protein